MAKEKDDEYKVVAFKTLDDDDETQVALPTAIHHVVQGAQQVQEVSSQTRCMQSIRKIAGSWSSFGDDSDHHHDESEQIARLRNQLSVHHQQMSAAAATA